MKMSQTQKRVTWTALIGLAFSLLSMPGLGEWIQSLPIPNGITSAILVLLPTVAAWLGQDSDHDGTPDILEGPNA
tara:strand:+ start:285 stop:509 length:225 start_codon:yes stop_codon:yes gene_type:complete